MPKIPTQHRATTNKQKVYFRATRMRENVRQKSTAQISRQTCVVQQNVQAVCKRVLVWFAIAQPVCQTTADNALVLLSGTFFLQLVRGNFFVGTKTHYYEPCKGKAFFCVASGEVST